MNEVGRFLAGVGALLRHPPENRYLLLRRAGDRDFAGGVWECVTGRLNQGEGFEEAVRREVREEVGARVTLEFLVGTTHFFRGAERPENELVGVVYSCAVADPDVIRIGDEHSEFRWATPEEARSFLHAEDPSTRWLRQVIARAETLRRAYPAELLDFHRMHGFELT